MEALEQRQLLSIFVEGAIYAAGLACANGGTVPVRGAHVHATYANALGADSADVYTDGCGS
jgi:hypothetical protein